MWKLIRNNQGASAVEFALGIFPVMLFMVGIIQTGYLVWANNLLDTAVDTAARCGAVDSITTPCTCSASPCPFADMVTAARTVFAPLTGAVFTSPNATTCNGSGLIGTYIVNIGYVVDLTLTAQSCYPPVS